MNYVDYLILNIDRAEDAWESGHARVIAKLKAELPKNHPCRQIEEKKEPNVPLELCRNRFWKAMSVIGPEWANGPLDVTELKPWIGATRRVLSDSDLEDDAATAKAESRGNRDWWIERFTYLEKLADHVGPEPFVISEASSFGLHIGWRPFFSGFRTYFREKTELPHRPLSDLQMMILNALKGTPCTKIELAKKVGCPPNKLYRKKSHDGLSDLLDRGLVKNCHSQGGYFCPGGPPHNID